MPQHQTSDVLGGVRRLAPSYPYLAAAIMLGFTSEQRALDQIDFVGCQGKPDFNWAIDDGLFSANTTWRLWATAYRSRRVAAPVTDPVTMEEYNRRLGLTP